ncbi:MAG TPA: hypothetical protein VLH09_09140 [Bryobacteraceae bacterium]|nr:hypothetical protein [Bryobacteraceae bacterium]
MNEAEARARLERMVAAAEDPVLSLEEIADLVALSRVADTAGLAPSDANWTPTFDLNRGAAEGWRWKAGKAAPRFQFTADGATFQRQQVLAHCERMAAQYRRKIVSNVSLPGSLATEA